VPSNALDLWNLIAYCIEPTGTRKLRGKKRWYNGTLQPRAGHDNIVFGGAEQSWRGARILESPDPKQLAEVVELADTPS
jgi:hypothetical protein